MAALRSFLCLLAPIYNGGIRGIHGLSGAVPPQGSQRERRTLLQFLSDHFYDVEALRQYLLQRKMSKVHQENRSLTHIREKYGPYIAGAFFVLKQGGAVKFQDHEWIRSDKRGHLFLESLKLQTVPVQAVDASGCAINYDGLDNLCEGAEGAGKEGLHISLSPDRLQTALGTILPSPTTVPLKELQSLSLQHCPHVDDWCLSRLYLLAGSLQELSLSGCPHITERGLACLHHLQNLRRLDISNLPAVSYPGLTRILVEEMLPNCEVLGMDEDQGLQLGPEEQPQDSASPNPA